MALRFSVVIPLFNRSEYISKAIQSVLYQTFYSFELIVVNDASTDESLTLASGIKDPRIKLVDLPQNGGNAKARNEGWKRAKGEWVVYLDSDDWYESNYLEVLETEIKRNPEVNFYWTGVRFVDKSGKTLNEEIWKPNKELPGDTFFDELRIGTNCGVAFKREMLKAFNGFNESFRASVDREFFLRISQTERGKGLEKILVNCLLGDHESVRKDYNSQFEAYSQLINSYRNEIESTKSRKKWWYHKAMWLALYCGRTEQAHAYLKATGFNIKSSLLYSVFYLFPLQVAKDLHKKLA